jgi:hypothetical protein
MLHCTSHKISSQEITTTRTGKLHHSFISVNNTINTMTAKSFFSTAILVAFLVISTPVSSFLVSAPTTLRNAKPTFLQATCPSDPSPLLTKKHSTFDERCNLWSSKGKSDEECTRMCKTSKGDKCVSTKRRR